MKLSHKTKICKDTSCPVSLYRIVYITNVNVIFTYMHSLQYFFFKNKVFKNQDCLQIMYHASYLSVKDTIYSRQRDIGMTSVFLVGRNDIYMTMFTCLSNHSTFLYIYYTLILLKIHMNLWNNYYSMGKSISFSVHNTQNAF